MEWKTIDSAPKDGTMIAVKFASGSERKANWQTTYGGEWHVDSYKFLPWDSEPTHWKPMDSIGESE